MAFSPMESKPLSSFDPLNTDPNKPAPPQPQALYSQYLNEELKRLRKRGLILNEELLDSIADKILNRIEQEVTAWIRSNQPINQAQAQELTRPVDTTSATCEAMHDALKEKDTAAVHSGIHQALQEKDSDQLHNGIHQTLREQDSKAALEKMRSERPSPAAITAKAS